MAEEEKVEEKAVEPQKEKGETVKKALKILLGVVLVVLGIWMIVVFWGQVVSLFKGCIGGILILAGLVCFLLAAE
ncbi:TPA: hypothetical protein DCX15_04875 [bacterium]|nr:hypothetical protein [bacterium]